MLGASSVALASNERHAWQTTGAGGRSAVTSQTAFVAGKASTVRQISKRDAAGAAKGVGAAAFGAVGPASITKRC